MGRLNGMSGYGPLQVAAVYGAAGQLTNLSYGGLSQTRTMSGGNFVEDVNQQVSYGYTYGWLGGVTFGLQDNQGHNLPVSYSYVYNGAGRVTSQTMNWGMYDPDNPGTPMPLSLTANYQWDNEGKMTSLFNPVSGQYLYQYDNMGRLNGMSRFGAAQGLAELLFV